MTELRRKLMLRVMPIVAWVFVRLIASSVRLKVVGFDNVLKLRKSGRGFILAVWHGRTLLPVHYCRGMGIWAITSLSVDGEFQTRLLERFGYQTIRGSSRRGGVKAALVAAKKLAEGGILSITPDGPMGPTHEVQEGVIFLAERAHCPIIPVGVGAVPSLKANAWDRYLIPMPFCKAAIVWGEPIDLSTQPSDSTESCEELIKKALDEVERQAQELAGEGS